MNGSRERRLRLFIAFDLPPAFVELVAGWQADALDERAWRPVDRGSLHVTLAFLGSRPAAEVAPITACVEAVLPPSPPTLALRSAVGIPRRRPRALALEADSPAVAELALAIVAELERAGLHEPEQRPFWAHLTVARSRRRGTGTSRRHPPMPPMPLPAALRKPVALTRLVLYSSQTRPEGAAHHVEARFDLNR